MNVISSCVSPFRATKTSSESISQSIPTVVFHETHSGNQKTFYWCVQVHALSLHKAARDHMVLRRHAKWRNQTSELVYYCTRPSTQHRMRPAPADNFFTFMLCQLLFLSLAFYFYFSFDYFTLQLLQLEWCFGYEFTILLYTKNLPQYENFICFMLLVMSVDVS